MEQNNTPTKYQLIQLLPSIGIAAFFGLFVYAATLYPGGSQLDLAFIGYDWANNYWCNLLNVKAMNGQPNSARPFAIVAMIILCFSLTFFFIQFAKTLAQNKIWKKIIPISGSLSMLFAVFVFTSYHDLMTTLSSIFGLFAVLGIIIEIYRSDWWLFKIAGGLCILLLLINNIIYYSELGITWLPLIQKISFIVILAWVSGLNIMMVQDGGYLE